MSTMVHQVQELGEFIRHQRQRSAMSLRKLSEVAGVSNPYLSQIERGIRRPSADILKSIARALSISAETLYERAGLLDGAPSSPSLEQVIRDDPVLTSKQKQALTEIYRSFVRESEAGEET